MQEFTSLIARVAVLAALAMISAALLLISVQLDRNGDSIGATPYLLGSFALYGGAMISGHLAIRSLKRLISKNKRNRR